MGKANLEVYYSHDLPPQVQMTFFLVERLCQITSFI